MSKSTLKSCLTLLVLLSSTSCLLKSQHDGLELSEQQRALEIQSKNDHETEDQRDEGDLGATATTSNQKICHTDILALLIQMSTTLTEQKAELKNAKTEISTLEARLKASEKLIEQVQKENEGSKVAFAASLVGTGDNTNIGPVNTRITLTYKHVFSNIGKSYNPSTGIFTAPVKGVYHFSVYVYAGASSTHPVTTSLMKNGHQVLVVHGHQAGPHAVNSSNGVSLVLEAGDVVYVQLWENRIIMDNVNCHSTFSGHLLFTL